MFEKINTDSVFMHVNIQIMNPATLMWPKQKIYIFFYDFQIFADLIFEKC